jgi:two-component system, OmpR family, sensor histidine kinase CpxA
MKGPASLRAKFALVALLNVAVLGGMMTWFVRHQLGQEFQSFLMAAAREKIVALSGQLTLELAGTAPAQREAVVRRYASRYGVEMRLFDEEGGRIAGPDAPVPAEVAARLARPGGPQPRPPRPMTGEGPPPFLIEAGEPSRYWIGVRMLLPAPDVRNTNRATLLLVTPTLLRNRFFFDWEPWLGIVLTAVAVTLLCWMPMVRGLTRDMGKMTTATAAVADGQFNVQLDTRRTDELGRLGGSINQMTARLRDYVEGRKRFLGDVAHELRSPLGRMQVALELLERKTPAEARTYIEDLREDVELLSGLTTELLTFARAELRREPVRLQAVALQPVVTRAVGVEVPDVGSIPVDIDEHLLVSGDENLLFRAISNLVRNAVRHAHGKGVSVAAREAGDRVILTIADRGPGVPEEALEKIFTPFFRLDTARGRKKGGTGLGLALVRNYVEECGGSVVARNRAGGGLEIEAVLRPARRGSADGATP